MSPNHFIRSRFQKAAANLNRNLDEMKRSCIHFGNLHQCWNCIRKPLGLLHHLLGKIFMFWNQFIYSREISPVERIDTSHNSVKRFIQMPQKNSALIPRSTVSPAVFWVVCKLINSLNILINGFGCPGSKLLLYALDLLSTITQVSHVGAIRNRREIFNPHLSPQVGFYIWKVDLNSFSYNLLSEVSIYGI